MKRYKTIELKLTNTEKIKPSNIDEFLKENYKKFLVSYYDFKKNADLCYSNDELAKLTTNYKKKIGNLRSSVKRGLATIFYENLSHILIDNLEADNFALKNNLVKHFRNNKSIRISKLCNDTNKDRELPTHYDFIVSDNLNALIEDAKIKYIENKFFEYREFADIDNITAIEDLVSQFVIKKAIDTIKSTHIEEKEIQKQTTVFY